MPDKTKGFPIVAIDRAILTVTGVPKVMRLPQLVRHGRSLGDDFDAIVTEISGNL
jgi:hypothetical protein